MMDKIIEEYEILKNKIKELTSVLDKKREEFEVINEKYQSVVGTDYAGINIKTKKASFILTRKKDGKAVTFSKNRNTRNEVDVYWYNNKKYDRILEKTRMNTKSIARWLRDYEDS